MMRLRPKLLCRPVLWSGNPHKILFAGLIIVFRIIIFIIEKREQDGHHHFRQ